MAEVAVLRKRAMGSSISPRAALLAQLAVVAFLLVSSAVGQLLLRLDFFDRPPYRGILWLFYVDTELRLPAIYSSLALLASAVLLARIALEVDGHPDGDRRSWALLSAVFVVLSIDELLAFHERAIQPVRDAFGIEGGPFFYAWLIPGAVVVVVLGLVLLPFLRRLPLDTSARMVLSAAAFLAGGMGLEAVAGASEAVAILDAPRQTVAYLVLVTFEEGLEMVGVAIFIATLLRHRQVHLGDRGAGPVGRPGPPGSGGRRYSGRIGFL